MKELYILDAVAYLFRSYYAIRGMTNQKGEPTNALYGFIRSVEKIIKDFSPTHIVAVFDGEDNKSSRTAIYENYKSHREGMPDDLARQLEWAHAYCALAGIPHLSIPGIEADDVIGTLANWAANKGATAYMCSSDKDLCQLINDRVFMLQTHKNNLRIDAAKVEELHGVKPNQMIDYLAIMGDSSDNIPGIPSFGAKTAAALLQKFGTLDYILDHPEEVGTPKKQQTVRDNAELARLSRRLATIDLNVPLSQDENDYARQPSKEEELQAFYTDMHFRSLQTSEAPATTAGRYHLINSEPELQQLLVKLRKAKVLCVDTETTSLSPMDAEIVGIGLAIQSGEGYYVPLNGNIKPDRVLSLLGPLIAEKPLIGHNLKYDAHALANHGIATPNIFFDTMIASYLIRPERNRHSLETCALEILGKQMTSIKELIGSGKNQLSMRDIPLQKVSDYCCEDVDCTFALYEYFDRVLKEQNLDTMFRDTEMPLLPVLFAMERRGIFVDTAELKTLSHELSAQIAQVEHDIYNQAGHPFNINSPKQLGTVLYTELGIEPGRSRGKTAQPSTSADVLAAIDHPICRDVLRYRGLEKLRSTYIDALPTQVNAKTGRIHCSFNQSVTATGRLSSQDPNLQNIPIRSPEGRKIRHAFRPQKEGWSFLAADYSQIELRLLAAFSDETALIDAFAAGEDIHAFTASQVFNVSLDNVTKEMRARAKAVNFGIIYGQQAFGLSQQLGISMPEAKTFIETYFARYPRVEAYLEESKERAREKGYAETLFGRKRPILDIDSKSKMVRAAAERLAVNSPLQGSQADIIKVAMIRIQKKLNQAFMVLQIHDELIFELPDSEIDPLQKMVREEMEGVVSLSVPLSVDIEIGKNWEEC